MLKIFLSVLIVLLAPAAAQAKVKSGCLTETRAERTWPGLELTTDNDGCWTYWRKGLHHIVLAKDDARPRSDTLTLVDVVLPAVSPRERSPEAFIAPIQIRWTAEERFSLPVTEPLIYAPPKPRPDPIREHRPTLLAVIAGIMFLCAVEAACGPRISMALRTRLAIRKNQLEEARCQSI